MVPELLLGVTSTDELEREVGSQVQQVRIYRKLSQEHLAQLSGVSVSTLSNLERGIGSSLHTVVAVTRALGRTDWLESLALEPRGASDRLHYDGRSGYRVRVRERRAAFIEDAGT